MLQQITKENVNKNQCNCNTRGRQKHLSKVDSGAVYNICLAAIYLATYLAIKHNVSTTKTT